MKHACNYADTKRPSDWRAALTPLYAHEHFGVSYKWMLFGMYFRLMVLFIPSIKYAAWHIVCATCTYLCVSDLCHAHVQQLSGATLVVKEGLQDWNAC
jgi:hypothetical protein